jgi:hypothetical protein
MPKPDEILGGLHALANNPNLFAIQRYLKMK